MSIILVLTAALLPAILLWLYIWKKDLQFKLTSWSVKSVLWGVGIYIPVTDCVLLVPIKVHGITIHLL